LNVIDYLMENQAKIRNLDIKRVPAGKDPPQNSIAGVRDGVIEHYQINNNAALLNALQLEPTKAFRVLNAARATMQSMTTGLLAPFFLPASITMEMLTAPILRQSGVATGPLTALLNRTIGESTKPRRALGGLASAIEAPLAPIGGAAVATSAFLQRTVSQGMYSSLNHHPTIVKMMGGEANVERFADSLANAYLNSTRHAFDVFGAGGAPFIDDMQRSTARLVTSTVSRKYEQAYGGAAGVIRGNLAVRAYVDTLQSAHNWVRLNSAYWSKLGKGRKALTRSDDPLDIHNSVHTMAARDIRRLTGDVQQKGSGTITNLFTSSTPYGTQFLQIGGQAIKTALKENPLGAWTAMTTMMMGGGALLMMQMENSPEFANQWMNELTGPEKAKMFPVMDPTTGKLLTYATVPPELSPMWAMWHHTLEMLMGYRGDNPLPPSVDVAWYRRLWLNWLNNGNTDADIEERTFAFESAFDRIVPRPLISNPLFVGAAEATGAEGQSTWFKNRFGAPRESYKVAPLDSASMYQTGLPRAVLVFGEALLGTQGSMIMGGLEAGADKRLATDSFGIGLFTDNYWAKAIQKNAVGVPLWWEGDRPKNVYNSEVNLAVEKQQMVRKLGLEISGFLQRDIGGAASKSRPVDTGSSVPQSVYRGSALERVAHFTNAYAKFDNKPNSYNAQLKESSIRRENIRRSMFHTPEKRVELQNIEVDTRRAIYGQMLENYRAAEIALSKILERPFKFEDAVLLDLLEERVPPS